MAKATTKTELLEASNNQYQKLMDLINSMSEANQEKAFTYDVENEKEAHWKRDKNIRDVLIHLYEWHQLFINWVDSNTKGIEKQFLLEGYTWKTYGNMNIEFWNKHQETSYSEAKNILEKSHNEVIKLIESFTNEDLFTKGKFKWTGTTTLAQYCSSSTSSHYDWAIKKIKKHIKTLD